MLQKFTKNFLLKKYSNLWHQKKKNQNSVLQTAFEGSLASNAVDCSCTAFTIEECHQYSAFLNLLVCSRTQKNLFNHCCSCYALIFFLII